MVGAADHLFVRDVVGLAGGFEHLDDVRRALRGLVCVDELLGDGDLAALTEVFDVPANGLHDGLAARGVGVADVELERDSGGDRVNGAGMDIAGAYGGYRVDGFCCQRVAFDGEDEFGGGTKGVAAVGHKEGSGVTSEAGDGEAIAGGSGDAGDDANGDLFALEERALLDVELDPCVIVVGRKDGGSQRAAEACGGPDFS